METLEDLRYPIGKYKKPEIVTQENIDTWILILEQLPSTLRGAVQGLDVEQLDTPYREGGWTIRQVIHHIADSHMNAYIRLKLALTEENPTIRPYIEQKWAELPEAKSGSVEISLHLIEALHARWVVALKHMSNSDWKRTFVHPEKQTTFQLDQNLGLYAWHSEHHLAHIVNLRKRMEW